MKGRDYMMIPDYRIQQFISNETPSLTSYRYHYTSPEGLKSILDTSTFRFTDCEFLNDKSEYVYIEKPLFKALEKLEGKIRDEVSSIIKRIYNNSFNVHESLYDPESEVLHTYNARYYAFCASNNSDLLNMWNYYVKNGSYKGYNIGFSTEKLLENLFEIGDHIEIFYGSISYSEEEQIDILTDYLIEINNTLTNRLQEVDSSVSEPELQMEIIYDSTEQDIYNRIQLYRLFFKDKAFIHENEYRFIIKAPTEVITDQQVSIPYNVDLKNSIFSPFLEVNFDKDIIKSITVSPMIEYDITKYGLERYLKLKGYKNVKEIKKSKVPIRF